MPIFRQLLFSSKSRGLKNVDGRNNTKKHMAAVKMQKPTQWPSIIKIKKHSLKTNSQFTMSPVALFQRVNTKSLSNLFFPLDSLTPCTLETNTAISQRIILPRSLTNSKPTPTKTPKGDPISEFQEIKKSITNRSSSWELNRSSMETSNMVKCMPIWKPGVAWTKVSPRLKPLWARTSTPWVKRWKPALKSTTPNVN